MLVTEIVIMAGLPGTGKSTLAQALAAQVGGIVLDKDSVRAALFSDPWLEYSREQDDFCVEILLQAAGYLLSRPSPPLFVFIDGRTFSRRYQVEHVADYAKSQGCSLKLLHLVCSDEVARRRLQHSHLAKNRDFALYLKVKAEFEHIERPHLTLNTNDGMTEANTQQCLRYLRGH